MNRDIRFWFTTLARGIVALLTGSAILVIPDMARTLLLLPLAITIAILGLAAYGVIDSVLILVSSCFVDMRRAKLVLRVQGVAGMVVGALLMFVVFERVQLEWFLTLAALQALSIAVGEVVLARHERRYSITLWDYAAAAVAGCFGVVYLIVRIAYVDQLTHHDISRLVYGYLVALGVAQCLTAARMIYADYHGGATLKHASSRG